ncbi:MAG TPA: hypothetical protein VF268_06750 [Gammaproteobacteria bacterium]
MKVFKCPNCKSLIGNGHLGASRSYAGRGLGPSFICPHCRAVLSISVMLTLFFWLGMLMAAASLLYEGRDAYLFSALFGLCLAVCFLLCRLGYGFKVKANAREFL